MFHSHCPRRPWHSPPLTHGLGPEAKHMGSVWSQWCHRGKYLTPAGLSRDPTLWTSVRSRVQTVCHLDVSGLLRSIRHWSPRDQDSRHWEREQSLRCKTGRSHRPSRALPLSTSPLSSKNRLSLLNSFVFTSLPVKVVKLLLSLLE